MKYELCQGPCELWLNQLGERKPEVIFADVPDNLGLNYGGYEDNLPYEEYISKLEAWTKLIVNLAPTTWISFNSRYTIPMGVICSKLPSDITVKVNVQCYTFYQHNKHDLGDAHRPLYRFQRPDGKLYPDAIKIPSWRQLNGDKRAKEGGKVPGNVFDFTRVTGNSKQRRKWCPTQLNEGLVERCIALTSKPGDLVVDPFAGTGTTLRVCKKIGRKCLLIELDPNSCAKIAEEHELERREKGNYSRWVDSKG